MSYFRLRGTSSPTPKKLISTPHLPSRSIFARTMSSPMSAIPTIVDPPPLSDDDDVLPLLLPTPPTHQTGAVKEIIAKVVSTKSAILYAQQNSIFALFCYKSADHLCDLLLEPWFIEGLNACKSATQKKKYAKNCCRFTSYTRTVSSDASRPSLWVFVRLLSIGFVGTLAEKLCHLSILSHETCIAVH